MNAVKHSTPLKNHVWALALLNAADGLLTFIGITSGLITEANPLLNSFSPAAILAIKVLLSLCLSGFLFTPFIANQTRFWRCCFIFANTLYSLILLLHIFWLIHFAL